MLITPCVTGDALTQFRFQDEVDWEDEDSEPADVMSLDCQNLAAALRCVPLHVRLGIQDIVPVSPVPYKFKAYSPVRAQLFSINNTIGKSLKTNFK